MAEPSRHGDLPRASERIPIDNGMKNPFSFIRSIKDLYRTSRELEDMHRLSHLWWSVLIIVSPIVIFSVIALLQFVCEKNIKNAN